MKKIVACFLLSVAVFAQTPTPNLGFQIPATGSNNWYIPLNYNFTKLDQVLSGNAPIPALNVTNDIHVGGSVYANQFIGAGGGSFATATAESQYSPVYYCGAGSSTAFCGVTPFTGIPKYRTTGVPVATVAADLVSLWTGCSSGTPLLSYTGTCVAGGGSGAVPFYTNSVDFNPTNGSGVIVNPDSVFHMPFWLASSSTQVSSAADGFGGLFVLSNVDSGTSNFDSGPGDINSIGINHAIAFFQAHNHSPGQGGGAIDLQFFNPSPGDTALHTFWGLSGGCSRGQDECAELQRDSIGFMNATFGGNVTLSTPNAQGHVPMRMANPGTYNYQNDLASGEQMDLVDVTAMWASSGNVQQMKVWPTNNAFVEIDGDSGSGIDARYPTPSTMTTITADVNNNIYTPNTTGATCPNLTDTGTKFPGGNGYIADRFGVNIYAATYPSSPANYCIPVASTAGMSPGTKVFIDDGSFSREYTVVLTVPDSTHFTAFMHQPKTSGAVVSFGGAVGNCLSSPLDDRPIGTSNGFQNPQLAITRQCYVVVANLTGNKLIIDSQEGPNEMLTLATASNAPVTPMTITPTIVGGVVTSIASNAQSGANFEVASTGSLAGQINILPPPVVTYTHSSAGTDPVITFKFQNDFGFGPSYIPTLVSGGTNVTGITVAATAPNPFSLYPHTIIYRITDPTCSNPSCTTPATNNDIWAAQGYALTETLAGAGWTNGDQLSTVRWPNRYLHSQTNMNGDAVVARSGSTGPNQNENYSFLQDNAPNKAFVNETPSDYYIGDFAHNWSPNASNRRQVSMFPGPLFEAVGIQNGIASLDFPPTTKATQEGGSGIGGTLFFIQCSANFQSAYVDHPCLHGRYDAFNLFEIQEGGFAGEIRYAPATGAWSFGGQSFFAPNISTNQLSLDTILLGGVGVNGKVNFSGDGSTVAGNLQLANQFNRDNLLCVMNSTDFTGCQVDIGGYVPDGQLASFSLFATGIAQMNHLQAGRGTPVNPTQGTYHGTAGSSNWQYWLVIKNALGQTGWVNPDLANQSQEQFMQVVNAASTLDASHHITVPCPAANQLGMDSGDTYELYSQGPSSFYDVGACPVGTTVDDIGSGASVSALPAWDANSDFYAGRLILPSIQGDIEWLQDIYNPTAHSAGLSESGGTVSVDSGTHGNHGGNVQLNNLNVFGVCTGCVLKSSITLTTATSDAVTVTGLTSASHCAISPENSTATGTTILPWLQYAANTLTVQHAATVGNGAIYGLLCTP